MKALEKYGEISMYKHLKYEPIAPAPNTILAIYQSPHSAQKLIGASPLWLRLELKDHGWKYINSDEDSKAASERQPLVSRKTETTELAEAENTGGGSSESGSPGQMSNSLAPKENAVRSLGGNKKWGSWGPSIEEAPPVQTSPRPKTLIPDVENLSALSRTPIQNAAPKTDKHGRSISDKYREYKLEISPSEMNHEAYIARQWYYGPFAVDKNTIMAVDLEGRVPLEGMLDCHVGKASIPWGARIRMNNRGAHKSFSLKELYEKASKRKRSL